jgi:hypothetical protein
LDEYFFIHPGRCSDIKRVRDVSRAHALIRNTFALSLRIEGVTSMVGSESGRASNSARRSPAGDLHCSSWNASHSVDPVGTAGSYAGFLLVDWPLPWPRDVSEIEELAQVAAGARGAGVRLQLVVPESQSGRRVVLYRWDQGRGKYAGVESTGGDRPERTALGLLADRIAGVPVDRTEVLICGHGRRDRCCGRKGTSLAIQAARAVREVPLGALWHVRRTSHLGGHRFAPNALVFPYGTCWAYLDSESITSILERRNPVARHWRQYRGCPGLGSAAVQAVERAVAAEVGWRLFDWPRGGEELGGGLVRFSAHDPDNGPRYWQARVSAIRMVPVPVCGIPVTAAAKTEPELAVDGLFEVA